MEKQFSFCHFVFREKANRRYVLIGLLSSIVYLTILRLLFPFPSFYADSYTYIDSALDHTIVSYRPIGYSEFIRFFHYITSSDIALIAAQYLVSIIANMFLFFTCVFLFPLPHKLKATLFVLLIFNPLYLLSANYVLSDSFFCSFTVAWFTTLIWVIYSPNALNMLGQFALVILLFKLRYNALLFPLFTLLALFFSKQKLWSKVGISLLTFGTLWFIQDKISDETEETTGTRTFSAFSGWQMANNAMHILRHIPADTTDFNEEEQDINHFILNYFDDLDSSDIRSQEEVTAAYIWSNESPLKKHLYYYGPKTGYRNYFESWTALGPIYNQFGEKVISQQPLAYCRYFVWPNLRRYFFPVMEAYSLYNEGRDTADRSATTYFEYPDNKTKVSHAAIHVQLLAPWEYIFPFLNFLYIITSVLYLVSGFYKQQSRLFNQVLLLLGCFYLGNLLFVSAVAPNVFRYHVFIITLLLVFVTYTAYYTTTKNTLSIKHLKQ